MVLLARWSHLALVLGVAAGVFAADPKPQITSFQPSAVNVGSFRVTIVGANFVPGSVVLVNGESVSSTYQSPTQLTFAGAADDPQTLAVTVSNPAPNANTSSPAKLTVMPPVRVSVRPAAAVTMRAASTRKFTVTVSNAVDLTVSWSVNGVPGGSLAFGTIAADGTYTAPSVPPSPPVVRVAAASTSDARATDTVMVTLTNPVPVITSVNPPTLAISRNVELTVRGTGFVPGASIRNGSASLASTVISENEIRATADIPAVPGGVSILTVSNPAPGPAISSGFPVRVSPATTRIGYLAAARLLDQGAFGPDPAGIARAQEIGVDAWISEQMKAPRTEYVNYGGGMLDYNQSEFFVNAVSGSDQLRQRVAYALGQIFVISGLKTSDSRQFAPFLNMLAGNAFGNFRTLLREVTLDPAMGVFLDMVNNDKADPATGLEPNENYARELLQLFTIGTAPLGPDGTVLEGNAYDESTVVNLSRAFTGWTYYSTRGAPARGHNSPNYGGPMLPVEANHDTGEKQIFGKTLPAGRSASADLDAALDVVFEHPNVGPFISFRLIQHLVTSNPSPAYIKRVASVFNDNGQNQRGDLAAVIRAILKDPEARAGDDVNAALNPAFGHLREPVLFLVNLLRALGATVIEQNPLESAGADMGQKLFYAPSVFNYYSPLYQVPGGLYGPEFQLLTPATTLTRANIVYQLIVNGLDKDVSFRPTCWPP